jgi:hypothetical protein
MFTIKTEWNHPIFATVLGLTHRSCNCRDFRVHMIVSGPNESALQNSFQAITQR